MCLFMLAESSSFQKCACFSISEICCDATTHMLMSFSGVSVRLRSLKPTSVGPSYWFLFFFPPFFFFFVVLANFSSLRSSPSCAANLLVLPLLPSFFFLEEAFYCWSERMSSETTILRLRAFIDSEVVRSNWSTRLHRRLSKSCSSIDSFRWYCPSSPCARGWSLDASAAARLSRTFCGEIAADAWFYNTWSIGLGISLAATPELFFEPKFLLDDEDLI